MTNKGMFSSKTGEWETPQWLFDNLDTEFGFTLDACATPDNAKCAPFFTKMDNGLAQPWDQHNHIWLGNGEEPLPFTDLPEEREE